LINFNKFDKIFFNFLLKLSIFTHPGPKKFTFNGHNYFYSGQIPEYQNQRVDWLAARNICREYCMDAVSMETQEENDLIIKLVESNDVPYIWTSGRLCDFEGELELLKNPNFFNSNQK